MTIAFRRVAPRDFEMLAGWLAEPHVHRWWFQDFTPEAIEKDFGAAARGEEPSEDFIMVVDHRPIGLLQRCRVADYAEDFDKLSGIVDVPDGAFTIDYLIGVPEQIGRGVGPQVIATAIADLFATHADATCVIVPVAEANRQSWRALEKAGFTKIGTGDLPPDNPMDDGVHVIYRMNRP